MPKGYCCKRIVNGELCGETDPGKFSPGRYTACKACRNMASKQTISDKKVKVRDDIAQNLDPDENIRYLIEDTIKRVRLINGNKNTVEEAINTVDEMNSCNTEIIGELQDKIRYLEQRLERLEKQVKYA